MSRYDSLVSAQAWEGLVEDLRSLESLTDFDIAEVVRERLYSVEGIDLGGDA